MILFVRLYRPNFQRVPYVTREEQDKIRSARVEVTLPLKFIQEDVRLAFEDEIALVNSIMRKAEAKEASDQRKARKILNDKTNMVNGGAYGPKATGKSKKETQKKSAAKKNRVGYNSENKGIPGGAQYNSSSKQPRGSNVI
jgi:hypothetical protein